VPAATWPPQRRRITFQVAPNLVLTFLIPPAKRRKEKKNLVLFWFKRFNWSWWRRVVGLKKYYGVLVVRIIISSCCCSACMVFSRRTNERSIFMTRYAVCIHLRALLLLRLLLHSESVKRHPQHQHESLPTDDADLHLFGKLLHVLLNGF